MSRANFLENLRKALAGFSKRDVDDIIADYEEYFREAQAAGRDELAVAKALGAPRQLARQLRVDARVQAWETHRSPSTLAGMALSITGVGLLNLLMIGPIFGLLSVIVALFVCAFATFCAGLGLMLASVPSLGLHRFIRVDVFGTDVSNPSAMAAVGFALVLGGVLWFAVNAKVSRWIGNAFARYLRFNGRLLGVDR
ncbi:MAG: DUF1700 domain-containing protein [Burkholderiales bacterium]|nr:DUF1700 domain-containing protein [Burkholderiales bacterium]